MLLKTNELTNQLLQFTTILIFERDIQYGFNHKIYLLKK